MRIVVGVTGASGAVYAVRLLEELSAHEVFLVMSKASEAIVAQELEVDPRELGDLAAKVFGNDDMAAEICSGSTFFDAMVIVPCSMNTLAKLACGISDNVITRAGSVALKERRKLMIVPRETPLNSIHLENMLRLSREGVIVLPAMPGFYGNPENAMELVDFVVGRILDSLGIENDIATRWGRD